MGGIGIHYRGTDHHVAAFELDDGTWLSQSKGQTLALPQEQALPIGLTSLRNALRASSLHPAEATLFLGTEPADDIKDYDWPDFREDVRLDLSDDGQQLLVALGVDEDPYDQADAPWRTRIPKVLAPLLKRHRCPSVSLDVDRWRADERITARFAVPMRGKTVGDAVCIGDEAWALLRAVSGGSLSLQTAVELVRTGFASALIDQEEGPWLEGKRAPYQLDQETQKFELAKEVAAFANSTTGGVLVLGARTDSTRSGDIVRSITELPLSLVSPERYRKILTDRVHPGVEGLEVRTVEHNAGRGVAFIHVPPQRPELQPFVVRGAIIAGKVHNTFVSIPERDVEDTRYSSIAEVHALLQAGRVALRSA